MNKYPWNDLQEGQSFFVPSLDPDETLAEGLEAGYEMWKPDPQGRIGIYKGMFGVLFFRAKMKDSDKKLLAQPLVPKPPQKPRPYPHWLVKKLDT